MAEGHVNGTGGEQKEDDELRMRALADEASIYLSRLSFLRQAGVSFKGNRDLYTILGYDDVITLDKYRARYERGGIAGTLVDVMPDACWRGGLDIVENEDPETDTPFEQAWNELNERLNLVTYMMRADKLSLIGHYAVMLIGSAIDGKLETELPKANGDPSKMIYLQPYMGGGGPPTAGTGFRPRNTGLYEAQVTIKDYDKDPASPRFGKVQTYTLRRSLDDTASGKDIHWSRIIHVAEGCLEDDVFGLPKLQRVWNLLDDLDKVTGGGAEAFWLRANQGTHIDIDKDLDLNPDQYADVVEKLKAQSEAYKHQMTRWLQTRGVNVQTLGSDVANFAGPADAIETQIAGASRIPKRILTGSEMGELASSQDRENFRDQVIGRQEQHVSPNLVRQLIDRLVEYGYLPAPKEGPRKYQATWARIQTMTEQERSAGALQWAQINATSEAAGHGPVFTDAEIRDYWYGFEPLTEEQRAELEERAMEKMKRAQEAAALMQPLDDPSADEDDPFAEDEEDEDEEQDEEAKPSRLKAAADYRAAQATVDRILGGPKANRAVRKLATKATLQRLPTDRLRELKGAYEALGTAIFPLRHVNDELCLRTAGEDDEIVKVLAQAMKVGNREVVDKILGIKPTTNIIVELDGRQIADVVVPPGPPEGAVG